jgi:hypothetical protein
MIDSLLAIRFAITLSLPQLLQRSRFTNAAMGVSGFTPKLASISELKMLL